MKLLIIDDMSDMILLAQLQFEGINELFNRENTFFFQKEKFGDDYGLTIKKHSEYISLDMIKNCSFEGFDDEYVLDKIEAFLRSDEVDPDETVLVIIDVCLKTEYTGAFTVEDYEDTQEISAQIYRGLSRIRNSLGRGWKLQFFIYSRSEIFLDVISSMLIETYEESFSTWFGRENCDPENISWAFNLWRPQQADNEKKVSHNYPINLSKDMVEHFRKMEK